MAEAEQLSAAAHRRLADELEDLTTRGRTDMAAKIEAARAHGDLGVGRRRGGLPVLDTEVGSSVMG